MMNEEIKALIEREAENRALESIKLHYSDITTTKAKFEYASIYRDVMFGANFALSLFRWRKVEEELPEYNESFLQPNMITTKPVILKTKYGEIVSDHRVVTRNKNIDGWVEFWNWTKHNEKDVIEWMPIPQ